MTKKQISIFDDSRMTLSDSIALTAQSLTAYAKEYKHWAVAFSGGKDSSALVTLIIYLLEAGLVPRPESLTVLYSDTRQEIPPLHIAALKTLDSIRARGYQAHVVLPPLDKRYFVYMLGRGVPPPNNNTLRWCTAQLKVNPMLSALEEVKGFQDEKILMLTGVRIGESAARDARIALSCGKNGAECGQGWFQETTPAAIADTLAPILHWRVCHVWDWLQLEAPAIAPSVSLMADVYGGEEAQEMNARTGCIGCPLATKDIALDYVIAKPDWAYLAPLKRLRPLYEELRSFKHRKQKDGERNKDGRLSANPNRKGPLTLKAREWALSVVLEIQYKINADADYQGRQRIDLINAKEESRIRELIAARTYPNKWSDDDPDATQLIEQVISEDVTQQVFTELQSGDHS